MDLKEIKRVIQMVEEAQISHLSLELDGIKIEVKKELSGSYPLAQGGHPQQVVYSHAVAQPSAPAPAAPAAAPVEQKDESLIPIRSQMVGTFYSASKPDTPPFAKVGDTIKTGQVLCIIEAMKLFNEIESEFNGTIEKVCVENGTPVEYGQELFLIRTH